MKNILIYFLPLQTHYICAHIITFSKERWPKQKCKSSTIPNTIREIVKNIFIGLRIRTFFTLYSDIKMSLNQRTKIDTDLFSF